jgi:hypothetical protein
MTREGWQAYQEKFYAECARRFPPPWSVEELDACFVVRDHGGQQLAHVYFEDEPAGGLDESNQLFCAIGRRGPSSPST